MGQVEMWLAFPALLGRGRLRQREDVRGLRWAFCLKLQMRVQCIILGFAQLDWIAKSSRMTD